MATKKKSKKAVAPKTKKTAIKSKKTAGKKTAVKAVAGKKNKASKVTGKAASTPKRKRPVVAKVTTPIAHGPDLHLIPVTGEIHPARREEAGLFEKSFKHNEETALHQEQQRVKSILAKGGGKRIFKNPRQS